MPSTRTNLGVLLVVLVSAGLLLLGRSALREPEAQRDVVMPAPEVATYVPTTRSASPDEERVVAQAPEPRVEAVIDTAPSAEQTNPPAAPPLVPEDFEVKYRGSTRAELSAAAIALNRRQLEIAQPILADRLANGPNRLHPVPEEGSSTAYVDEHSALHAPYVIAGGNREEPGVGRVILVAELRPYEVPELQLLREEEVWLHERVAELVREDLRAKAGSPR